MQNANPTPEQRERALRRLRRLTAGTVWGSAGAAVVLAGVSAMTYAGASSAPLPSAADTSPAVPDAAPAATPAATAAADPTPAPTATPVPVQPARQVPVAGAGAPHATTGASR